MRTNQHPPLVVTDPYTMQRINVEPLFRLMHKRSDPVCNAEGIASLEQMLYDVGHALNSPDESSREILRAANLDLIEIGTALREMAYPLSTSDRPTDEQNSIHY